MIELYVQDVWEPCTRASAKIMPGWRRASQAFPRTYSSAVLKLACRDITLGHQRSELGHHPGGDVRTRVVESPGMPAAGRPILIRARIRTTCVFLGCRDRQSHRLRQARDPPQPVPSRQARDPPQPVPAPGPLTSRGVKYLHPGELAVGVPRPDRHVGLAHGLR